MDEKSCTIEEVGPFPLVRPDSITELREQVRRASSMQQAIYPVGGRTHLDLGFPPERPGLALDLTALSEVIDYPARDMTITVQAGIRLAKLQQLLASEGQRLPVDLARPEQATLGGALATNCSGSRRLGWGTLRDYVIGISTINDEGQETKAGGRVVKNVAGYDLCKLHIGALGTLGVLSQVTLKVRPRPEEQAILMFGCEGKPLEMLLDLLHSSRTRPTCIDLINAPAVAHLKQHHEIHFPDHPWVVLVAYEDSEQAVAWQMQQLLRELTHAGIHGVEAIADTAAEPLWRALTELTAPEQAMVSVKFNLLPSQVSAFVQEVVRLAPTALLQSHAGSGIVLMHLLEDLSLASAQSLVSSLTATLPPEGNLILPRCPTAWKRELPIWGKPRNDLRLMRQVKQALDPRRLFNPGRFLDGI